MPKNQTADKQAPSSGYIVGCEAFTAINAIEGIELEPHVLALLKSFEERDLPAEDRLRELHALTTKVGGNV